VDGGKALFVVERFDEERHGADGHGGGARGKIVARGDRLCCSGNKPTRRARLRDNSKPR
jgi:hypothetical protein